MEDSMEKVIFFFLVKPLISEDKNKYSYINFNTNYWCKRHRQIIDVESTDEELAISPTEELHNLQITRKWKRYGFSLFCEY